MNSTELGRAGGLVVLGLLWGMSLSEPVAWGQTSEARPQDYVFIETLLSLQGAVIGGGFGVLLTAQALDSLSPCARLPLEEVSACHFGQAFQALCLGSAWGLPLGATVSLGLAGRLLNLEGSLPGALLGSLIGELVGLPQCSLVRGLFGSQLTLTLPTNTDLTVIVNPVMLSALGATLGFNLGGVRLATPPGGGGELVRFRWSF